MQLRRTARGQERGICERGLARVNVFTLQSNDMGCLLTTLIVAVCLFVPTVGHIFLTVMIIGDDLTNSEKLLWLLLVWLVPVAGPLLYLLLGQRRNRLL